MKRANRFSNVSNEFPERPHWRRIGEPIGARRRFTEKIRRSGVASADISGAGP
jgi:hypothetical protein